MKALLQTAAPLSILGYADRADKLPLLISIKREGHLKMETIRCKHCGLSLDVEDRSKFDKTFMAKFSYATDEHYCIRCLCGMMRDALVSGDVKFRIIYSSLYDVISVLCSRIEKAMDKSQDSPCKKELRSISDDLKKLIDFHEVAS